MYGKPFYILTKDYLWLMIITDTSYIKEQCSATGAFVIIIKPLFPSRHTERLTREACKTDIKSRYFALGDLGYITGNIKIIVEVRPIGFLCFLVPFAYKHGFDVILKSTVKT